MAPRGSYNPGEKPEVCGPAGRRSCYQAAVRDPYEVLGVSRAASDADIKAAFRKLAMQHHPDKNPDSPDAHDRFTELNQAHQILSDPQKRAAFDRYGESAFDRSRAPGFDFSGLDSIFGDLLGAFGFRGGDRGELKKTLQIGFEEAARGCQKELTYERIDLCGDCNGRGGTADSSFESCSACGGRGKVRLQQGVLPLALERTCGRCRGRGSIPSQVCTSCRGLGLSKRSSSIEVTIPAGIEHQASRRVSRGGNRVSTTDEPGDLELCIEVGQHSYYRRSGDDVICSVPITFAQAALGGQLDVPTLWGKVKLKIPASTQPGSVLRVRGHGLDRRLRGGRGDQLVEVRLEVPTRLTPRAQQLLEELGRELGEDVQPQHKRFMDRVRELLG